MEPPPFQEASRCDVCKCSFNTFRRRHHCRCCGRTLCHEHSSDQMVLPQFGITSAVRVCADCFNNSPQLGKEHVRPSLNGATSVADAVSKLNIDDGACSKTESTAEQQPVSVISECKCGMPLCICEAPVPSMDALPKQSKPPPVVTQSYPRPKKTEPVVKNRVPTSSSKPGSAFNRGQTIDLDSKETQINYEVNGEGLREAIKNGDLAAVKSLLNQGVDVNYRDKQGFSLLHLAAVFNKTEIAFTLMDGGATLDYKNAQGETPLDCAPATLQYKMRQKMEEQRNLTSNAI